MMAYGQTPDQPCSQSQPCHKICGDHPCAPGETYTLSANQTTTVQTRANTTSTNQTQNSGVTSSVGIMANATATKNPTNMTMATNATGKSSTNMTITSHPAFTNATVTTSASATPKMVMPKEQVASGTQPKDVKCESGFELVINQFHSRPACVKSDIASLLVERGWGMLASGSP